MKTIERGYYEQKAFWQWSTSRELLESERFRTIINYIPSDVVTLLDAGCGNGSFLKELQKAKPSGLEVFLGIDWSWAALEHVEDSCAICGSVTKLPFRDRSFDMVTSQEVLEHFPYADYPLALAEIQRVSKKYILVSVPNSEDLENALCACPHCYCRFNSVFHIRSFDEKKLQGLFTPLFELRALTQIGPQNVAREYPQKLIAIYHSIVKPVPSADAVCPQCGFMMARNKQRSTEAMSSKDLLQSRVIKWAAKLMFPERIRGRRWLLALYRRILF